MVLKQLGLLGLRCVRRVALRHVDLSDRARTTANCPRSKHVDGTQELACHRLAIVSLHQPSSRCRLGLLLLHALLALQHLLWSMRRLAALPHLASVVNAALVVLRCRMWI